jgi:uncharacterized protein
MNLYKKINIIGIVSLLSLFSFSSFAQDTDIPERPSPPRLVNDFAGFLNQDQSMQLEQKLVAYDDSTSVQIAIVVVKSLNGYEVNDMATRIGNKWGIGQKDKNNGILILVQPKTQEERGQVAIITGYGSESTVPDIICKRIIDNEIIPSFKNGQFYEGLDKATATIYSLLRGEFTPKQYLDKKKGKKSGFPVAIIIIIIIVIIASLKKGSSNNQHMSSGGNLPFWMLLGMMGSGNHRGSFGDFNSGGGGFGGFGGGSFGGGGASGSW